MEYSEKIKTTYFPFVSIQIFLRIDVNVDVFFKYNKIAIYI